MIYHVYLLTNNLNRKIYVGQTIKKPEDRFREHVSCSKSHSNTLISRAIRKYGSESFTLDVLFEGVCTLEELDEVEKYYIEKLSANDPDFGYNLTMGGRRGEMGEEFNRRGSEGKLRAKTKRPDSRARMLARSQEEIRQQASNGGKSIKGVPKKGDGGRKGSSLHAAARTYRVSDPEGRTYTVTNLSEFCRANGLCSYCMRQVASPKHSVKSHKGGWTCDRVSDM